MMSFIAIDADSAKVVHLKEISKSIDEVAAKKVSSVEIEVLVKSGVRAKAKAPKSSKP